MRHATGLSAVVLTSIAASIAVAAPSAKAPATSASLSASAKMLDPIQVESLTLTPIVSTEAKPKDDKLLVLDEAMAKKLVRIHEVKDEDVNNLTLTNKANQPLFLLAGEVIIGGKQDRIIGKNTIVPPKKTLTVPVFCVEHGRWDNTTKEFTTAKALAHGRLRGKAMFDTQSDVWQEVAAKNEARKTKSSTDTYRKVAAQQSDGTLDAWSRKVDAALAKLPEETHLVGFAVAVNGKVATVDVFDSPALFKKLQTKLVRSYITDAIDVKKAKDIKPPTSADIKAFIADAEKAQEERAYETDYAASATKKGDKAAKARVMLKAAPAAEGAPVTAAPPKAVYESYQAR